MYLRQTRDSATGKIYLSVARSFRVQGKNHPQTQTMETFGCIEDLKTQYEDPVAYFKEVVAARNIAQKQESAEHLITQRKDFVLEKDAVGRKNYGYIIIVKLLHELGIDRFLINRRVRDTKIKYDTSAIMKLLVISRILSPGSKKRTFDERARYFDFEKADIFDLTDIYRSLSHFAAIEKDMGLHIHKRITKNYCRNLDLIYYDITNFYFEIDKEDGLRKKGVSKEHRPDPIVQMGLAMDADGLPISYEVFPGNESEKLHLRPMVFDLRNRFESGRVIAVADSAQNTGNNVYYLDQGKQGYVFSQSIRGGSRAFKDYVADPAGYEWLGDDYKRKSRVERREIQVDFERADGTTHKKKVLIDQRQIVFYSEKYAARSRVKREAALLKAQKIIDNPSAYTRATSYGALKYIQNVEVDKDTGEIKEAKKEKPCFNLEAIREEEKYDGYYCIVTNLFDETGQGSYSDAKIIDIYRGLWRIEDSFKVTKGEFEARPIYLSREDRIKAHFLICFISLVIVRLIQRKTGGVYSPERLIKAMNDISCSHEDGSLYLFDHRDDVTDDLGKAFGIDFTLKRLTRNQIRKNIGAVKK